MNAKQSCHVTIDRCEISGRAAQAAPVTPQNILLHTRYLYLPLLVERCSPRHFVDRQNKVVKIFIVKQNKSGWKTPPLLDFSLGMREKGRQFASHEPVEMEVDFLAAL